jgi:isopenicillin N synthase-like dioxygenase
MDHIPLIDISAFSTGQASNQARIAKEVGLACETVGFLYISGHGVSGDAIAAMRRTMEDFFALPEARKRMLAMTDEAYRGYIPMSSLSANSGAIKQPDLYEGFKLHCEHEAGSDPATIVPENVWPDEPGDFRDVVTDYWQQLDQLSDKLLRIFALALELDEQTFTQHFVNPMTNMTLLHYPPMESNADGFGIHPHKDSDAFTILYPDTVGGLEVQPIGGDWIVADCPQDCFVINIGNMMELWSGGRFLSTPHKVVNRSGAERFSFPYFAIPNEHTVIKSVLASAEENEPGAMHVGEFMNEVYRTNRSNQKPKDDSVDLGTLPD